MALIVTSGGLGPTADDLTAEVVGEFAGREMVLDDALEERIAEILRPLMTPLAGSGSRRDPGGEPQAGCRAARGHRARSGRHGPGAGGPAGCPVPGPRSWCFPGPPRELHEMWEKARSTEAFRRAIAGARSYRRSIVRLYGLPESEIANTLRAAEEAGVPLEPLEITTCLRRGEIEVATRYEPAGESAYEALIDFMAERHGEQLFSRDGSTVDAQVASLLSAGGWWPSPSRARAV